MAQQEPQHPGPGRGLHRRRVGDVEAEHLHAWQVDERGAPGGRVDLFRGPELVSRKLEAFGLLNAMIAMFVQNELAATASSAARRTAYPRHVAAAGIHPRVTAALTAAPPSDAVSADPFDGAIGRVLNGLLG